MNIKRLIAVVLLILGSYYLLVAVNLIPSTIVFGDFFPDNKTLAIIAVIIIAIGLLLDDKWRRKLKNAFS